MGARAERRKERSGKGRRRRIRAIRTLSWNATDIGSFVASSTREDDNSPLNTAITTVVFRWRRNSCVNRVEIRTGNGSVRGIIVNSCLIRCQRADDTILWDEKRTINMEERDGGFRNGVLIIYLKSAITRYRDPRWKLQRQRRVGWLDNDWTRGGEEVSIT